MYVLYKDVEGPVTHLCVINSELLEHLEKMLSQYYMHSDEYKKSLNLQPQFNMLTVEK